HVVLPCNTGRRLSRMRNSQRRPGRRMQNDDRDVGVEARASTETRAARSATPIGFVPVCRRHRRKSRTGMGDFRRSRQPGGVIVRMPRRGQEEPLAGPAPRRMTPLSSGCGITAGARGEQMPARRPVSATLKWLAGTLSVAAGAYAGYVGMAWLRYGRPAPPGAEDLDPLLDRFMPNYDVSERHHVRITAPADVTFSAACDIDLRQSPLIRTIFRA